MGAPENLRANLDKVLFNTYFNTDKVVQTFTGSYLTTTDTITRAYTYAGSPNNVQVYRFAHGFTRPLFTEMTWSLDNIIYTPGAGTYDSNNASAISYSDSTYIYVMATPLSAGTRVYYKVVCSWIDDYDGTTPSIPPFENIPDAYTQVFTSRALIPSIVDQGVIEVSTTSTTMTDVISTSAHGGTYAPEMKVFIEAFSGEVWPLNYGGSSNPYLVDDSQVEAQAFTDPTNFIVDTFIKSANGTRRIWYLLYGKQTQPITAVYGELQSAL